MTEIIQYILRFMLGEHFVGDMNRLVGYTSDVSCFGDYKIVIIPSGFFDEGVYGTDKTEPSMPLNNIEGIPFFYGSPDIEQVGDTLVVRADLVASAFFLISRYEEILHRDLRDDHGRFPGHESLPFREGFIDRPVVDEYGKLIRKWLKQSGVQIEEPAPYINKINLTHDVDAPFFCRTWRNVARCILSGVNPVTAVRYKYGLLENDPYYTFPWMFKQDDILRYASGRNRCQSFVFFKAGGKTKQDKPRYDLHGKDIQSLFNLCREHEVAVGLHCSYQSGQDPSLIMSEKKSLEEAFGVTVTHCRNHFLASREPEDMEYLEKAGITDDYTIGYADVAGFRLGTSMPVRYINPVTRRLSSLTLHPLIIMDCTLNERRYMNLKSEKAEEYCDRLIKNIRKVNGELTLLWHNTSVIERQGYLRDLYGKLIKTIG